MLMSSSSLEDSDHRDSKKARWKVSSLHLFRSKYCLAVLLLLALTVHSMLFGQSAKLFGLWSEFNQPAPETPSQQKNFEHKRSIIQNFDQSDRVEFAEEMDEYLLTLTGNTTVDTPINPDAEALAKQLLERIPPRAYPKRESLPCFPAGPGWSRRRPVSKGLMFTKSGKVGGSTAAGVHNRMARNYADRIGANFSICLNKFKHGDARVLYGERDLSQSLMWTILRNPSDRWISTFFFNWVARRRKPVSYDQFVQHLNERLRTHIFGREFYLKEESVSLELDIQHLVASIIYDYDFVAITERMDESIVAMALLWNVPLSDVLYLSAKTGGGYDDGESKTCKLIPSAKKDYPDFFVDPRVKKLLQSEYFHSIIRFDSIAYQLANQSLDYTIDTTIGRVNFEKALQTFRHAQKVAQETCSEEVIMPCTNGGQNGTKNIPYSYKQTDCLLLDQGCGYMCLDQVATDLNLWPNGKGLQYRFPREFGLGPSTLKRLKELQ